MSRLLALLLLGLSTAAAQAAPGVELRPGQALAVTLPAEGFSNAVYIDVPSGAERLTVRLDAADLSQDVDLLLRFGTPFPDASYDGRSPSADWLMEHAQFRSIGSSGDESVVITPASTHPLRAGRLYLSLINFSGSAAPATLSASFGSSSDHVPFTLLFDDTRDSCDTSGWNDSTPRNAVRGNSGATLGQQRRNAVQEAARLLAAELRPNAPIRIQMCWKALTFANCSGTLAQAGPRFILVDNPGGGIDVPMLDERYVVQASAVAAHQSGTDRCRLGGGSCANPAADIKATFNSDVDAGSCNGFDYGFTADGSSGSSFITTAMHEIAHGLGFIGFMNLEGAELGNQPKPFGQPFDDGYGRLALDVDAIAGTARPLLRIPTAERVTALTAATRLRLDGAASRASSLNIFNAFSTPANTVRLHSPSPLSTGSTYSHLATQHRNQGANQAEGLMTASIASSAPRTLGLAKDVLKDVGWHSAARQAPNPAVAPGQYYDVARDGHGFDLRPIDGFDNLYFVVFYSFDANGRPEYFTSTGPIVDGVFQPHSGATGDSLLRNRYLGPNQTVADPDPNYHGDVRIDFDGAARHPACNDGAANRRTDGALAVMSWEINGTLRQWCTQPLVASRAGIAVEFSSTWFQPADGGWGLSVLSFPGAGGDGVALQLYFPDANGNGRWALMVAPDYQPGQTYMVQMVDNGYCRTCSGPPAAKQLRDIGTMTLDLRAPGEGTSKVSFDVTWPGAEGGRFTRNDVAIVPVGTPGYRQ